MRIDAVLARQGDGFAQTLDDRADHEVAAELYDVRHLRLIAHDEHTLADSFQHGTAALDDVRFSCGDDKQLPGFRRFGTFKTGAAMYSWPCSACSFASRCDSATLMVLDEMCTAPLGNASATPMAPPSTQLSTRDHPPAW